jgi:hypothetical protein
LGPATLRGMTLLSGGGIVLGTAWLAMRQQAQQTRARAAELCQRAAEEHTRTAQLQATRCRLEAPARLMARMV